MPWPWIAALAAASLAILCSAPAQHLGRQQDDLLYIIGSQSLAQGSYRLFTSIGQPPMVAVVPGLSILLLPVTWLCGGSLAAYQASCALIMAGLPWLLWWWLRRRLGEAESALAALVFATSPLVLCQSGTVMSEAPYTALAVLFLSALETSRWPAAGLLLTGLSQLRLAGLSLLPAAAYSSWRRGGWQALAWTLAPAAAASGLWYAWSHAVSKGAGAFHQAELLDSYAAGDLLRPLAVAFDNARFYLAEWGSCFLHPSWSGAGIFVGAALAALALRGARRVWPQERARPAVLMLAGAAAMHAFWPWQYDRYLIPLLPWLLWLLAAGAAGKSRWLLAALIALQLGFHSHRWVLGRHPWRVPELGRTYDWVRSRTGPADAVTSALPVRDGFLCARPSLPLPQTSDAQAFVDALRRYRVRRVLWQEGLDVGLSLPQDAAVTRRLRSVRAILDDSRRFRLVHEQREEGSRVYELL